MGLTLTDGELNALAGIPHLSYRVYVSGIRRYMDIATGITGSAKRRISLKGLAEECYIEPKRGRSDYGEPTQKAIRYAIKVLINEGLLVRLDCDDYIIFRLPLAATDNSASGNWGTARAQLGHTTQGTAEANDSNGSENLRGIPNKQMGNANRGTHPLSVNNSDTSYRHGEPCGVADEAKKSGWRIGVQLLTEAGSHDEKKARSFIGKLIKQHGDAGVIAAITFTAVHNPASPAEYLVAVLQQREKRNGKNSRENVVSTLYGSALDGFSDESKPQKPVLEVINGRN